MSKLMKPLIILMFVLSIATLVMGVMLYNKRAQYKERALKLEATVLNTVKELTAGRSPFVEAIDKSMNKTQLADVEQMNAPLKVYKDVVTERFDELFDTYSTLDDTRRDLAQARGTVKQKEAEIVRANSKIDSLTGENEQKDKKISMTMAELKEAEDKKAELESDIRELNGDLLALEEKNIELISQKEALEQKVANLDGNVGPAGAKIPDGLTGEVLVVNPAWNFVVINLGKKDFMAPMADLLVYRGDQLVGKLRVLDVKEDHAIAKIIRSWQKETIVEGDKVLYTTGI